MKVAILIKGAVSKVTGKLNLPGQLYREGNYINYSAVYNSIAEHIVKANTDCEFDFFMHSWNYDIQEDLFSVFKPVRYLFEDNNKYKQMIIDKIHSAGCSENEQSSYSLTSYSLSIKFGCELIEQYVNDTGNKYDLIIVYRPDVMMWKDMNLSNYDKNAITLDNWQDFRGEMHFVMNYENMLLFKGVYDSISATNMPTEHRLFNNFLLNILDVDIKQDDIIAGVDEAPVRYLYHSIVDGKVSMETLLKYGFTEEELKSYVNIY